MGEIQRQLVFEQTFMKPAQRKAEIAAEVVNACEFRREPMRGRHCLCRVERCERLIEAVRHTHSGRKAQQSTATLNVTVSHHERPLEGSDRLERISWRCNLSGASDTRDIGHVFLMTGAVPNTKWLIDCVALDDKGFVRTGSDLSTADLTRARWPLQRTPHLLETSLPGVFAVGDVRSGSTKRIASAVGEGSISVQFVHKVLREIAVPSEPKAVAVA